ncbi:hypothetical protein [Kineococcus sp. SYSU DK005]|uniref:hypothetical protein n=1 Tax=Kineococcus sp. SYSU DK005 TaxID=3383126 RepID=UPI003D7EC018
MADRDKESITWIVNGLDGSEAHVTVRERPFRELSFRRTHGEPGTWANLGVLRVGMSTLVGFRIERSSSAVPRAQDERAGGPHPVISLRDDLGSWYATLGGWGPVQDVDWGLRFNAPPLRARTLWVSLADRGEVFAEYVAELR